jgi:hypothetical protein
MHSATLVLNGVHTGPFSFLKIYAQNNLIFEGQAENYMEFNFSYPDIDRFIIKIKKIGKTKDIVDQHLKQEIIVASVKLNGCDMHADKFGNFFQCNNAYLDSQNIANTNKLYLNGEWSVDLPIFGYQVNQSVLHLNNFRDTVEHSNVACFGCSFTYGANLKPQQTWPHYLSQKLVGRIIKNYGRGGNSIQEIMSTALDYAKNYDAESVICLLPHPSRMQLINPDNNELFTFYPGRSPKIDKKFPRLCKDIVMYGETSLLLSGYVNKFKNIIEQIKATGKKVFISCYDIELYEILKNLSLDSITLLPYYERDKNYPCSDDAGHPGEIHNRLFAENVVKYVL